MNDTTSFVERTVARLRRTWREIALRAEGVPPRPELPADDSARLRAQLRACLDAAGGEVSARARAAELGRSYLALDKAGRERFLRLLADEFSADRRAVDAAIARVQGAPSEGERWAAERALRGALEPPRVRLLTRFNALDEGVKFLVDMRAELLGLARGKDGGALGELEADLKDLLAAWFDIGFLELRRITWNAPAAVLEKLAAYEAVHAVKSWQDLKNRLDSDRRCFAFFHPNLPDEPLIFVEVALVDGMADNVQSLLDEAAPSGDPRGADAAIFYSISNAQRGLAGISFGAFLIKRVVESLQAEFPNLKIFATLSPIPGFRRWLDERLDDASLEPKEWTALASCGMPVGAAALKHVLADGSWIGNMRLAAALKVPIMRLCARYLIEARRPQGGTLDPVAHFHLSNGARMERLNWLGDRSEKGLRESAGVMINYLYRLDDIETNHEAYVTQRRIAASAAMHGLSTAT